MKRKKNRLTEGDLRRIVRSVLNEVEQPSREETCHQDCPFGHHKVIRYNNGDDRMVIDQDYTTTDRGDELELDVYRPYRKGGDLMRQGLYTIKTDCHGNIIDDPTTPCSRFVHDSPMFSKDELLQRLKYIKAMHRYKHDLPINYQWDDSDDPSDDLDEAIRRAIRKLLR